MEKQLVQFSTDAFVVKSSNSASTIDINHNKHSNRSLIVLNKEVMVNRSTHIFLKI